MRLMEQNPHCHWCGIEVVYFYAQEWGPRPGQAGKMPTNFATLDHIYDRWDWEIRLQKAKERDATRHVLACNACNRKRNNDRMKEIPKDAHTIRQKLGKERKLLGDTRPRPQVFRGLNTLTELSDKS